MTQCSLHFDIHQKIKFIAYIYFRFHQKLEEKSDISAKNEAVKHLHAVFLLTANQGGCPIRLYKVMVYFDLTDVTCLNVVIGM